MLYFVSRAAGEQVRLGASLAITLLAIHDHEVDLLVTHEETIRSWRDRILGRGHGRAVALRCQIGQKVRVGDDFAVRVLGTIGQQISMEVQTANFRRLGD